MCEGQRVIQVRFEYFRTRLIKRKECAAIILYAKSVSFSAFHSVHRYLGFVEFVERMGTGPDAFDVTVTGEWYFEAVSDPFTGGPATAVRCDLERVKYLTFDNQAETWASLGPIKLMDIVYLAEDVLITRGNVNPDALFVFQKG